MSISSRNNIRLTIENFKTLTRLNLILHVIDPLRSFVFESSPNKSNTLKIEHNVNTDLTIKAIKLLFLAIFFPITLLLALVIVPIISIMRSSLEKSVVKEPVTSIISATCTSYSHADTVYDNATKVRIAAWETYRNCEKSEDYAFNNLCELEDLFSNARMDMARNSHQCQNAEVDIRGNKILLGIATSESKLKKAKATFEASEITLRQTITSK